MSSVFSSPKRPRIPQMAESEPVEIVEEDAAEAGRRRRKKLLAGGAASTRISGIMAALRKRLGRTGQTNKGKFGE